MSLSDAGRSRADRSAATSFLPRREGRSSSPPCPSAPRRSPTHCEYNESAQTLREASCEVWSTEQAQGELRNIVCHGSLLQRVDGVEMSRPLQDSHLLCPAHQCHTDADRHSAESKCALMRRVRSGYWTYATRVAEQERSLRNADSRLRTERHSHFVCRQGCSRWNGDKCVRRPTPPSGVAPRD